MTYQNRCNSPRPLLKFTLVAAAQEVKKLIGVFVKSKSYSLTDSWADVDAIANMAIKATDINVFRMSGMMYCVI
jgi:hypothetical protein